MLIQRARWRLDTDIVVIGYGAAGATAAITAHDAGAQVIVLEKQAIQTPISNSFMSSGIFICPNDTKKARQYMEALYRVNPGLYWTEPHTLRAWVEHTRQNKEWVARLGVEPELFWRGGEHELPGVESIEAYRIPGMGPGMMRMLYRQVKQRNIQVMNGLRACNLLMNPRGEIIGVRVIRQSNHELVNIKVRRAVILAMGGFEFDEPMKLQYLGVYPCHFDSAPSNTGDGIRMALEVGAQLWHMNCCAGCYTMKFPEVPTGMKPAFGGKNWYGPGTSALQQFEGEGWLVRHSNQVAASAGYIVIDRNGRRYTDENFKPHLVYYELTLFDSRRLIYPRVPSYWIFDEKRLEAGPLARVASGTAGPSHLYKWSRDNSEELSRGWIKTAGTVKELAPKLGVNPRTLVESVNSYNRYCDNGLDVEFGREPHTLIPLTTPPYYAVELWPGGMNTQGGPHRNARAQVMRVDGSPIPRLYSAGELGSIYGMLYPGGGGNLAECLAFGRIAGENAAGCSPF